MDNYRPITAVSTPLGGPPSQDEEMPIVQFLMHLLDDAVPLDIHLDDEELVLERVTLELARGDDEPPFSPRSVDRVGYLFRNVRRELFPDFSPLPGNGFLRGETMCSHSTVPFGGAAGNNSLFLEEIEVNDDDSNEA